MSDTVTYFSRFCIDLTEVCNLRCRHCLLDIEENQKLTLDWPIIQRIIKDAAMMGDVKEIAFVGGEPFLEFDTLVRSVNLCNTLGIRPSVVTNGFWAISEKEAKYILSSLGGLWNLCVSTDIFHQEFVPIERIRNVILSCHDLGIECHVYVSHLNNPENEIKLIISQLEGLDGLFELKQQPVIFIGRAEKEIDIKTIFKYDPRRKSCDCIDSPLVTCNGNVIACCGAAITWPDGHPLQLGNIHNQNLIEIRRAAELNPILHAIRLEGPEKLIQLVQEQAHKEGSVFIPPPINQVTDLCSLCKYIIADQYNFHLLLRAMSDPEVLHSIAVGYLIKYSDIGLLLREVELSEKNIESSGG